MKLIPLFLIATMMCFAVTDAANLNIHRRTASKARGFAKKTALIIIDMQNDFVLPTGSLLVADAITLNGTIQDMITWGFDKVVATKDWHPANHSSFAGRHDLPAFSVVTFPDKRVQKMWPDHCVQNTPGAELFTTFPHDKMILKGSNIDMDSYSTFFDNDHKTQTELDAYLKEHGIERVVLTGVATNYCVGYSAIDAASLGYETYVVSDACKPIPDGTLPEMEENFRKAKKKGLKADSPNPVTYLTSAAMKSILTPASGGSSKTGGAVRTGGVRTGGARSGGK